MKTLFTTLLLSIVTTLSVFASYELKPADVTFDSSTGTIIAYNNTTEKDISIPETINGVDVKIIGENAFSSRALTNVTLPSTLESIENYAFYNNNIITADFSSCASLKTIKKFAFQVNNITSLNLSACTALEYIGWSAFNNNAIPSLDLSQCTSLTTILYHAFSTNEITTLNLPSSITSMGRACFNKNKISSINGNSSKGLIYKVNSDGSIDSTVVVSYGGSATTVDFIPEKVIELGDWSFSITAVDAIDLSNNKALSRIGDICFQSTKLSSVDFSANTSLLYVGSDAFNSTNITSFELPVSSYSGNEFMGWKDGDDSIIALTGNKYIVDNMRTSYEAIFKYTLKDEDVVVDTNGHIISCSKIFNNYEKDIIIPKVLDGQTVTGITGSYSPGVFESKGLTSVELPSTLVEIGYHIFKSNKLKSVTIPSSVQIIKEGAFRNNEIEEVIFEPNSQLISIGRLAVYSNRIEKITLPASLVDLGEASLMFNGIEVVNFEANSQLSTIQHQALYSGKIDTIIIPTTVTSIGEQAFKNCSNLDTISLTSCTKLTSVGENAFVGTNISSFELPVPNVTGYTFNGWKDSNGSTVALTNGKYIATNINVRYTADMTALGSSLTISVSNGTDDIEGALINLSGYGNKISDSNGEVLFPSVEEGVVNYSVSAAGYKKHEKTINMENKDSIVNVVLYASPTTSILTIKVTNGTTAVEGAVVELSGYGSKISDSNGEVLFPSVEEGVVNYSVSATGYKKQVKTINMEGKDSVVNVVLATASSGGSVEISETKIRTKIYPNPAKEKIFIETSVGIKKIELYTLHGNLIEFYSVESDITSISLNNYNTGIFLVKVTNEDGVVSIHKIIKE